MEEFKFIVKCDRIGRRSAFSLTFPFNNQLVDRIKNLQKESRKWNSIDSTWELTTKALYDLMKSYKNSTLIKFIFKNEEERKYYIEQLKKIDKEEEANAKEFDVLVENKKRWLSFKEEIEKNYSKYEHELNGVLKDGIKPFPHQITGVLFLNEVRNALISHEMGLGKSLLSILYSELNKFEKVFVITPNSLKFNYYNEVNKFTNSKAHIVGWKKNQYSIEESKYIIVNYDFFNPARSKSEKNDRFLNKWKKLGIDKIDCLICDESHKLKNMKTNIYKNFKRTFTDKIFRDGKVSKVFLSGTPAPNRAYELYSVLNQISPIDFPNKTDFYEYYCGMKYNFESGWGYEVNSEETKFEELFEKLSPYTHRKRKSEVLTDLPDKIHQRVMLDISDKELSIYNDIENGVVNEFVEKPSFNPLTIMIRLRQYTSQLKIKHLTELIDSVLETNEKVVIIDSFKESLNELHRIYPNISVLHTGDEKSPEIRDEMVKQFQDEKSNIKIFLASIQTANYGLTLTAANKMFILTVPYSYGEFDQVSSRCHRIGQKNVVNIYSLIFPDTIDDYVYSALESKKTEIAKVMDNENYTSDYEDSVLNEVINKIKIKHGV